MTRQETQVKFNALDKAEQRRITREAGMIRECGANCFYIETGCHASDPGSWWLLVAWAMLSLGLITSREFYGV